MKCWQGWFILRSLSLAYRWLLFPVSSLGPPSVCVGDLSVYERVFLLHVSFSQKDKGHFTLGYSLMISFSFNYLFNRPSLLIQSHWDTGCRTSAYVF